MSVSELRRSLRSEGRRARAGIEAERRRCAERRIANHLDSLQLAPGRVVGGSVADDGEPDLGPWLALARSRGHVVALPVPAGHAGDGEMHFCSWHADDELTAGRYGIPCPPDDPGRTVVPDVVLVPLVRFDPDGNRLGRGAGYYDRWLAAHRPMTIGVAFEVQRADRLPVADHDVPLDAIVTDLGVRFMAKGAATRNPGDCPVPGGPVDKDVKRCG